MMMYECEPERRTPTPRQLQVLQALADGDSYALAGKRLGISVNTVKSHMEMLLRSMNAYTAAEAVAAAMRKGWIR